MAFLDRIIRKTKPEDPGLRSWWGGLARTTAGVKVDEDSALTLSTYWGCIRVLGETAALLPWHVFLRRADGGRTPQPMDPAEMLLHMRPNPEMGPFAFKETMVRWAASWGNAYAEISRKADRVTPTGLWPIHPRRVTPRRLDGEIVYEIHNPDGSTTVIPAKDMFHLHGPGSDGLQGYSVARMAKESIALGKATEQFGASFFGNGTSPGAVLTHPETLSKPAEDKLREHIRQYREGPSNQHRLLILEDAMKFDPMGTPPEDAQFLQTREFQVPDVCRWFRMPPHKVSHLNRATWSNLGEQNTEFATDTMAPWTKRLEEEADRKLLIGWPASMLFTRLNLNALMRGDPKSRALYFRQLRDLGVLDVDEMRALEDLNPIGGEEGKLRLVPMNMQRIEDAAKEPEPVPAALSAFGGGTEEDAEDAPEEEADDSDDQVEALKKATSRLFASACETVLRKEARAATRAATRHESDPSAFVTWVCEFYGKHEQYITECMLPAAIALTELAGGRMDAMLAARLSPMLCDYAEVHCERSREDLRQAYAAGMVCEAVKDWLVSRPGEAAVYLTEHLAAAAKTEEVTT